MEVQFQEQLYVPARFVGLALAAGVGPVGAGSGGAGTVAALGAPLPPPPPALPPAQRAQLAELGDFKVERDAIIKLEAARRAADSEAQAVAAQRDAKRM
jgi:hypothetical protein